MYMFAGDDRAHKPRMELNSKSGLYADKLEPRSRPKSRQICCNQHSVRNDVGETKRARIRRVDMLRSEVASTLCKLLDSLLSGYPQPTMRSKFLRYFSTKCFLISRIHLAHDSAPRV